MRRIYRIKSSRDELIQIGKEMGFVEDFYFKGSKQQIVNRILHSYDFQNGWSWIVHDKQDEKVLKNKQIFIDRCGIADLGMVRYVSKQHNRV